MPFEKKDSSGVPRIRRDALSGGRKSLFGSSAVCYGASGAKFADARIKKFYFLIHEGIVPSDLTNS